jgi:hypothetical protein
MFRRSGIRFADKDMGQHDAEIRGKLRLPQSRLLTEAAFA